MKKILLSTSAIVAAGLLASTGAMAQYKADPNQTPIASGSGSVTNSPIQINVGGTFNWALGTAHQNENHDLTSSTGTVSTTANAALGGTNGGGGTAAAKSLRNVQIFREGEIRFRGESRLDNGLLIGVRVNYEAGDSVDQVDEAWAFFDSAYGRVEIGDTDGAPWKMAYAAPTAVPNFGTNTGQNLQLWNSHANTSRVTGSTSVTSLANDADKINYFTPRIFGFQLGLSYSAENCREGNTALGGNYCNSQGIGFENAGTLGQYGNTAEIGLNYVNKFDLYGSPLDLGVYIGGSHGQKENAGSLSTTLANTSANTSLDRDPIMWSTGMQLGYAGFQIGGGYKYDNGAAQNAQGKGYNLGLKYNFAPFSVGVEASHLEFNEGMNTAFKDAATGWVKTTPRAGADKSNKIFAGGTYLLGPGITMFAGVGYVTLKNGDAGSGFVTSGSNAGNSVNNTSTFGVIGTALTF